AGPAVRPVRGQRGALDALLLHEPARGDAAGGRRGGPRRARPDAGGRGPAGGGRARAGPAQTLAREAAEARPEPGKPFWIRNFRCWEANWSLHLGTTGVFVDGLDTTRSDVAIWRSIMDGS